MDFLLFVLKVVFVCVCLMLFYVFCFVLHADVLLFFFVYGDFMDLFMFFF